MSHFLRKLQALEKQFDATCGGALRQDIIISGALNFTPPRVQLIPKWRMIGGLTPVVFGHDDAFVIARKRMRGKQGRGTRSSY
jgi:hypothetical protein